MVFLSKLASVMLPLSLALGLPAAADEIAISGSIDYTAATQSGDVLGTLSQHNHAVVRLRLELLQPAENNAFGYAVTALGQGGDGTEREGLTCGLNDHVGLIDNLNTQYEISLSNEDDHHAPTTIYVGDRLNYPMHSIHCEADMDAEDLSTKLVIQGHFVVATALIPTAQQTILYPIHVD